jgi:alkylated DNA repair dioxygenase AlkB
LQQITDHVFTRLPAAVQGNINLYEHGKHSVGWHRGDEKLFNGLHRSIGIVSLSLGATRTFEEEEQHKRLIYPTAISRL